MKQPLLGYNIDQEGLWKHSLLTAMISKRLCQRLHQPFGETAFTAGLLHDIGKLVLSIYVNEVNPYLLENMNQQNIAFNESEEKIIGFDHAVVGGLIGRHWNLPELIVEPIIFHHKPAQATQHQDLAYIIHLANGLANTLGLGLGTDSFLNPLDPNCLERFQLNENDLELFLSDFADLLTDPNIFS